MKKQMSLSILLALGLGMSTTGIVKAAEVGSLESDVTTTFTEDATPGQPVDPTDPTQPVETERPGTSGPLSLDVSPSLINFGSHMLKAGADQTFYALPMTVKSAGVDKEVPNYTQVTDKRGGRLGWRLNVKQATELSSTNGHVLTGAVISFQNTTIVTSSGNELAPKNHIEPTVSLVPGADTTVMSAESGKGYLTWVQKYGDLVDDGSGAANINDGISLFVPSGAAQAATYTTKLTWSLNDTPGSTV